MNMPGIELINKVREVLRPYLPPDVRLVVGVSGGPDSLALLYILKHLVGASRLVVAHLNHGLRPEADAEMGFVAATAVAWGLPIVLQKISVTELTKTHGWSLEEAGRHARYQFLAEVAEEEGAQYVAVGHHADDQAETVLMHFIRGSGLAGLRGMATSSPLPGRPEMTLLRPLLTTPRLDIEAYCAAHQLQPLRDQSNDDTTFYRNKLRHELLPLLAAYNPQIKSHLQQLAAITTADYEVLESQFNLFWNSIFVEEGVGWLALTRGRWLELPLSYRRLALRRAILALRPSLTDIGFRPIELARELVERGVTGSQMDLPGDLTLSLEYQRILIFEENAVWPPVLAPQIPPQPANGAPLTLTIPGQLALGNGWVLTADLYGGDTAVIIQNNNPWVVYADVGETAQLQVRGRFPGERWQPLGMHGRSTTVKESMIDRKIAQELRANWPIVANNDHLIWLVGHHLDERARVSPTTRRIVCLSCRKAAVLA